MESFIWSMLRCLRDHIFLQLVGPQYFVGRSLEQFET
jgi:hypothetical protein